jgi:ribosomal protein S2
MEILTILKKFLSIEILSNKIINLKPQHYYIGTRIKKQYILNYKLKIFKIFEVHKLVKDILNFKGNFIFIDSQIKTQRFINKVLEKYNYFPKFDNHEKYFITKHLSTYSYKIEKFQNILIVLNTSNNQQIIEEALRTKTPIICILDEFLLFSSSYSFAGNSNSIKSLYSNIIIFIKLIAFYKNYNKFLVRNYYTVYNDINTKQLDLWKSSIKLEPTDYFLYKKIKF